MSNNFAQGAVNSIVSQGMSRLFGESKGFSWREVAISGAGQWGAGMMDGTATVEGLNSSQGTPMDALGSAVIKESLRSVIYNREMTYQSILNAGVAQYGSPLVKQAGTELWASIRDSWNGGNETLALKQGETATRTERKMGLGSWDERLKNEYLFAGADEGGMSDVPLLYDAFGRVTPEGARAGQTMNGITYDSEGRMIIDITRDMNSAPLEEGIFSAGNGAEGMQATSASPLNSVGPLREGYVFAGDNNVPNLNTPQDDYDIGNLIGGTSSLLTGLLEVPGYRAKTSAIEILAKANNRWKDLSKEVSMLRTDELASAKELYAPSSKSKSLEAINDVANSNSFKLMDFAGKSLDAASIVINARSEYDKAEGSNADKFQHGVAGAVGKGAEVAAVNSVAHIFGAKAAAYTLTSPMPHLAPLAYAGVAGTIYAASAIDGYLGTNYTGIITTTVTGWTNTALNAINKPVAQYINNHIESPSPTSNKVTTAAFAGNVPRMGW